MAKIREQIHRNAVALISLAIALTSLGYNTWRNETSEAQRNVRLAAFQVLESLGQLERVAHLRYYYRDESAAQQGALRITGFEQARLIKELTMILPDLGERAGTQLFETWQAHFGVLDERTDAGRATPEAVAAEAAIFEAINQARSEVLEVLKSLE